MGTVFFMSRNVTVSCLISSRLERSFWCRRRYSGRVLFAVPKTRAQLELLLDQKELSEQEATSGTTHPYSATQQ